MCFIIISGVPPRFLLLLLF
uniref:Uncharacterized protein n=1 Tax=Arundo donax TaxID=35708 RepID=A0A0A9HBC8_ARUDO